MKKSCKYFWLIMIAFFLISCNEGNDVKNKDLNKITSKEKYDSVKFYHKMRTDDSLEAISLLKYSSLEDMSKMDVPKGAVLGEKIWIKRNFNYTAREKSLKDFALNLEYEFNIPNLNKDIEKDILRLRKENPQELKLYIYLILAKIYKSHLTASHQSYDLGRDLHFQPDFMYNPILHEFCTIADIHHGEPYPSGVVMESIEKDSLIQKNALILKEIDLIEKVKLNY
ncbi:hypothetical protein BH10BAC1_BH10BAC1_08900 [soil metagenome]